MLDKYSQSPQLRSPGAGKLAARGTRVASTLKCTPDPLNDGICGAVHHAPSMSEESCGVCGGDGRVGNAFGGDTARCPGCRGTGRRQNEPLWHDVTKTKPSHHQRKPTKAEEAVSKNTPTTPSGISLAKEVAESNAPEPTKQRLVREIVEYEGTHGRCTKTFTKKVRKQL